MARRHKAPLREITNDERRWLTRIARSPSEPATHVARARQLLAVAAGLSYSQAAISSGRKSSDAVAKLVSKFNARGVSAIARKHGGGAKPTYEVAERERILAEARRAPDPDRDGAATWSLMSLRRALRKAPDGLPKISTYTIRAILREAGFRWPRTRSWCETGQVMRKRKSATVKVNDPETTAKKT
jgi:transposase